MAKNVRVTKEGLEKLEKELEYLVTVRRAEVAQKLKEARGFGDLSENAEYDEAKNEQGILEAQIAEMEATVANATVVSEADLSNDEVGVGSVITIYDMEMEEEETLQLVGSTEADPDAGRISDESPIGLALLKKHVGDVIEVQAPGGILHMKVVNISKR